MLYIPHTPREWFVWTALQFIGKPYRWGGDDPSGFDCSGLVIEAGKAAGIYGSKFDNTASGLFHALYAEGKSLMAPNGLPGSLIFWGKSADPKSIYHVEICVGGDRSIGASGGGSTTVSDAVAMEQNAFIKIRPTLGRGGVAFHADPFLGSV